MQIFKEGPTIVLHKIPKSVWFCLCAWWLLLALNQGLELVLTLSDFGCSVEHIEVVIPSPVDRSI